MQEGWGCPEQQLAAAEEDQRPAQGALIRQWKNPQAVAELEQKTAQVALKKKRKKRKKRVKRKPETAAELVLKTAQVALKKRKRRKAAVAAEAVPNRRAVCT